MMTYYIIDEMRWVTKKNPYQKKPLEKFLLKSLLYNRGIKAKKDRNLFLSPVDLDDVSLSLAKIKKGQLKKAEKRLREAKEKKQTVLIYGDYDVDGFCGTALVWEFLYGAGLEVIPYIPSRDKDGYGLNQKRVLDIKKKHPNLSLVITVDNGIVANKAVSGLKKEGIETIIIDHHLPGKKLPEALAIIHSTLISGSGAAWLFVKNLSLDSTAFTDPGLAALGTVADMLPVTGINRSIIKYGISYLETTQRPGFKSLFKQAGITPPIDTQKIAFNIAPRLNALGRVADPLDGLRLICVRGEKNSSGLAKQACLVNSRRQMMTKKGFEKAEKEFLKEKKSTRLIVSSSRTYHRGIVGLIAGKLTNKYGRPAVIISVDGQLGHGSARSIEGFNIVSALRKLDKMLLDVGGHPLAAGFTINKKDIDSFSKKLKRLAASKLEKKTFVGTIKIDQEISLSDVNRQTFQSILKLAPFGIDNPQPIFSIFGLRVVEARAIGSDRKHVKILVDDPKTSRIEKRICEAVGFGFGDQIEKILSTGFVDIAFNIEESVWQGRRKIILKLVDLKPAKKMLK